MNKILLTATCLVFCFLQGKAQTKDSLMTVEETIQFVQRTYIDAVPPEAIAMSKRANPAAKEKLHQILNDPTRQDIWPQVIGAFAYMGDRTDVAKMENFLRKRQGVLSSAEYSAVVMLFIAYGGMGERGVHDAKVKLKQMMKPDYWRNNKFNAYARQPAGYPAAENQMRLFALHGYAYTLSDDFDQVALELVTSTTDANDKKILVQKVKEASRMNTEYKTYMLKSKSDH